MLVTNIGVRVLKNPNSIKKDDPEYYCRARNWPSLFNIKPGSRILDIGCGTGLLGRYLIDKYDSNVTGLDIIEDNYQKSSKVLHHVFFGNIETMDVKELGGDFDYIIFSDSLEHMIDPDKVVEIVKGLLTSDGVLLISMPNVRNFRVTLPLLLLDSWEYQNEGLLDRTHMRFFTRSSLLTLLDFHGFRVCRVRVDLPIRSKVGILNLLTLGLLKRHLTSHYFVESCVRK
jgi:2-polyprenyl-3-methyl-5-hydroxy-6-metoxy-1,4-benzoquinol methylase